MKKSGTGLFRNQLFIPLAALLLLMIFNLIADPSFFKISLGYNSAGKIIEYSLARYRGDQSKFRVEISRE